MALYNFNVYAPPRKQEYRLHQMTFSFLQAYVLRVYIVIKPQNVSLPRHCLCHFVSILTHTILPDLKIQFYG